MTKKALHKKPDDIDFPERLDPKNVLSQGHQEGWFEFLIKRMKNNREKLLVRNHTSYGTSQDSYQSANIERNIIDYLDLIYLTSDSYILDYFVKLLSYEWQMQENSIYGTKEKAKFTSDILSLYPFPESRLIEDIDIEGFKEIYATNLFLIDNLATGAKKEGLLYLLGLINARSQKYKDWMVVIVIDEFEAGLHISRQKLLVDALLHIFKVFPHFKDHIRIILSTHSPIIFSELGKDSDLVDVLFVLREPNNTSCVYYSETDVAEPLIENRIISELGLNLYDWPERIMFVEGKTDKAFFDGIFKDIGIYRLDGPKIPKLLKQLITTIPIARHKKYYILTDKGKAEEIRKSIVAMKSTSGIMPVRINADEHDYETIEEFILGIPRDKHINPEATWKEIQNRVDTINKILEDVSGDTVDINVAGAESGLRVRKKAGLVSFYESIKKHDKFYTLCGEYWRNILNDKEKRFIENYAAEFQINLQ